MVAALLIGAIIHAVAATDPHAGVIPMEGKHRLGGVSSAWQDRLPGATPSQPLERAVQTGLLAFTLGAGGHGAVLPSASLSPGRSASRDT
eukprot:CAMPEP_0175579760 /NCGR_PEP_ID=MMETSP0096-20121207/46760_1 /TAXON_ID=311494 /ORGANISM="Alexandrium monilatum, Strain CCMP3105" /LENGTH=89 /DNA_ID=CAMNT_0016883357 /DNA_START=27 /DNA_END=294 /DNA_ORIENTATION=+